MKYAIFFVLSVSCIHNISFAMDYLNTFEMSDTTPRIICYISLDDVGNIACTNKQLYVTANKNLSYTYALRYMKFLNSGETSVGEIYTENLTDIQIANELQIFFEPMLLSATLDSPKDQRIFLDYDPAKTKAFKLHAILAEIHYAQIRHCNNSNIENLTESKCLKQVLEDIKWYTPQTNIPIHAILKTAANSALVTIVILGFFPYGELLALFPVTSVLIFPSINSASSCDNHGTDLWNVVGKRLSEIAQFLATKKD